MVGDRLAFRDGAQGTALREGLGSHFNLLNRESQVVAVDIDANRPKGDQMTQVRGLCDEVKKVFSFSMPRACRSQEMASGPASALEEGIRPS